MRGKEKNYVVVRVKLCYFAYFIMTFHAKQIKITFILKWVPFLGTWFAFFAQRENVRKWVEGDESGSYELNQME